MGEKETEEVILNAFSSLKDETLLWSHTRYCELEKEFCRLMEENMDEIIADLMEKYRLEEEGEDGNNTNR